MSRMKKIMVTLVLLGVGLSPTTALANPDVIETGRLLAVLLDSGRVTIGANQSLINDPAKGDKGFTPEVFEQQLIATFKQRTGIDLADLKNAQVPENARPMLLQLVEESKKTVASYQATINIQGIKYKGLIPATFGTEAAARFQRWSGIYLKQTAPDHLLRNPKNKADEFEAAAFQKFADPSYPRVGEKILSETVEDGKTMRILLPLFLGKACLSCHGRPKGERDISGYPKEGGIEGELGGAISVKLKLKEH
jgi:hypothetical protein